MNARSPVKTLLVLVVVLSVAATLGAVVANLAPTPQRGSVEPRTAAHGLTAPRAGARGPSRPARGSQGGEVAIAAYVNLYAIAGVLTCLGVLACWGRWQTHHRCPSCGYCPATSTRRPARGATPTARLRVSGPGIYPSPPA
jgi:hypothetical protein